MEFGEQHLERRVGTSVISKKIQLVEGPATEVYHEGCHVRIRVTRRLDERAVMIPLRNGFPLYATDRTAQCFTVLDSRGCRVATAVRIRDFGLHLMFDTPPTGGDYFIHTQTPVGRA